MRGPKFTPHRVDRPPTFLEPPAELTDDALEEWHRTVAALCDFRIITLLDRGIIAAYCQAYGRWAQAERALANSESLHVRTAHMALTDRAFERTPAARLGNRPVSDQERTEREKWLQRGGVVSDRSALLMLGLR